MGVNGIYGLSGSGLDIESMVKVGMMGKQNEYDKMAQKFTKNEWTKAAYLELSSSITTFNMSTLSQYKMSSNMNAKTATSSDTSAVTVTANASAANMSHTVQVESLSSNAYLIGTNSMTRYAITSDTANSSSNKLADVLFKDLNVDETTGRITGHIATSSTKSAKGQKDETITTLPQNAGDGFEFGTATGDRALSYDSVAFSFKISDGVTEKEISYTYGQLLGADGSAKTFNDLVSDINSSGLNIRASYDSVNDKFSFYNTKGGSENTIKITMSDEEVDYAKTRSRSAIAARNFFNNMGLYQSVGGKLYSSYTDGDTNTESTKTDGVYQNSILFSLGDDKNNFTGIDGKILVDGAEYKTTDNRVTVGGITYNALNKTDNNVTVTVSQDVDTIVDKVKSFVESYNKLLSSLYEKYDEKPDSNYKPLTQAQKDEMKDDQVEKWEEKAKKGLLYHDSTLGKIITEMRETISTQVEGLNSKYNSAYSIGISTTGIKGQLVLDETKLKNALAADSDSVYNVFAKLGNVEDAKGNEDTKYNGIAQRLGDVFSNATKNIRSRAGSSADITEDSDLNNLLRELQTKMSNFKKLMNSFEDRLYKKYDAMEVALASLGMQLNYVTGAFS